MSDQIDISTTATNSVTTGITNTTSPQQPPQYVMKEISTLNNSVREFKVLLRELNGIRAFNNMRTVSMMIESLEKNIRSVRECFKCEICFISQYNHFFFCQDCGRMVGCFLCAYRLDRCPTCRKRLPPKKNRSPHVIPGLAAAMDEKELSRDELWKQVEKIRVWFFFSKTLLIETAGTMFLLLKLLCSGGQDISSPKIFRSWFLWLWKQFNSFVFFLQNF